MKQKVIYKDLGLIEFGDAWDIQKKLASGTQFIKADNLNLPGNYKTQHAHYLLFCEHPHVYTLGKSGTEGNLLVNTELLKQKGATFYKIDRGGDITYHGPGQIVGYPIFNLQDFGIGVKQYVHQIEEAIIQMLHSYNIQASRLDGATGVWIDTHLPAKTRKICAIGVKVSRAVTMHGFALNVNTDLSYFGFINPCGFTDKGVTSMETEMGVKIELQEVKKTLMHHLSRIFDFNYDIT
ncbi:MAG: lipoyl(octanoyl) transferase LipB [Bacteroidales bacterium]